MGETMRKTKLWIAMLGSLALLVCGCGLDNEGDFDAGNRLIIQSITDEEGSTAPTLFAVEWTDDSGLDGELGTGDEGEGDGFPDLPEEDLIEGLSADKGILTILNQPRLGVDPGVDLECKRVKTSYKDASGNRIVIEDPETGSTRSVFEQGCSVDMRDSETVSFEFILLPEEVKKAPGGLRDRFLFGDRGSVSTITATVDVWARDVLNEDTVHTQQNVSIDLINPTEVQPQ